MATPETRRQLLATVAACEDKKGEDTRILELDSADSGLADFFLITSAANDRQVIAIADEIEFRLKKEFGLYPASVEGRRQAEWILLDYVDIVIHVFLAEKRAFYDIERLRKSARKLTGPEIEQEIEAELRSALAQKTRAVRRTTNPAPTGLAQRNLTKSTKGDSTVSAKPAKKASKKAAKKSPAKPLAKKAVKKAAKPVAKKAVKKAARKAVKPAPAKAAAKKSSLKPAKKTAAPPKKAAKASAKAPAKAVKKAAKAPLKAAAKKLPAKTKAAAAPRPAASKMAVLAPPSTITAAADSNDPAIQSGNHEPFEPFPPPPLAEPTQGVKPPIIKNS